VFINMVLFPLNHKSVVSMRKMQEIQPETKANSGALREA
jgi:membrane protein insertase Oxa1/YidC/SpoIIIJ